MSVLPAAVIKGLPISQVVVEDVLDAMDRAIRSGDVNRYISITNTESMYHGLRVSSHGDYIRQADFSLCDGVGVIAAGLAWGYRIHRLNGPILQLECTRFGLTRGWRHFFYGGKEGVADAMAKRLVAEFPGLTVCGTYCPPFGEMSEEDDRAIIETINAARPDIVWVGLGLLKQERWIQAHLGKIKTPWMIGVGGAFDYHSGAIPWAPPALRQLGLEWVFRLVLQPRLRAVRYWWSLVYVIEAAWEGIRSGRMFRPRSLD